MTNQPYTDDDLRAEAARIHKQFTAQPDEGLVGEVMESGYVPSVETSEDGSARTWVELLEPDGDETPEYAKAQRAVTDLIRGAADVSGWAVALGADGLVPDEEHVDIPSANGVIGVRIHFAFHPAMPEEMRASVIEAVHLETAAPTA
ncbi:hypothetical protein [Streptomyces sp. ALI-76-A]|uniref:hypothetical protein n=1 Tax=Streptomyces sp. ALI-76-A TaxID=3025736 RepID=UPI00256EAEE8|nr:hypothetical protein [Streptomyces sp. ALI-76-A]MDL5205098.1 hypothetical protein [Streptomyces sp. ALI-76-A]